MQYPSKKRREEEEKEEQSKEERRDEGEKNGITFYTAIAAGAETGAGSAAISVLFAESSWAFASC